MKIKKDHRKELLKLNLNAQKPNYVIIKHRINLKRKKYFKIIAIYRYLQRKILIMN